MFKFKILIVLFLGIATIKMAYAQETTRFHLPMLIDCNTNDKILQVLTQFEEVPFAKGMGTVQVPNGSTYTNTFKLYLNPTTYMFSIIFELDETRSCIVMLGDDFAPWFSE